MLIKSIIPSLVLYGLALTFLILMLAPGVFENAYSLVASRIDSASLAWVNFRGLMSEEEDKDADSGS